jgi:hypothetical protein
MICLHVAFGLSKSKTFKNKRKLTANGESMEDIVRKTVWKEIA